jgi:hypothetical protein
VIERDLLQIIKCTPVIWKIPRVLRILCQKLGAKTKYLTKHHKSIYYLVTWPHVAKRDRNAVNGDFVVKGEGKNGSWWKLLFSLINVFYSPVKVAGSQP